MPPGERAKRTEPAALGAAVREPSFSTLNADVLEHAVVIAIFDHTPKEAAALADAEAAHKVHEAAKEVLPRENPRHSIYCRAKRRLRWKLKSFIANEVPAVHPNRLSIEEVEVDEGVPAAHVPDMMDRYLAKLNGKRLKRSAARARSFDAVRLVRRRTP